MAKLNLKVWTDVYYSNHIIILTIRRGNTFLLFQANFTTPCRLVTHSNDSFIVSVVRGVLKMVWILAGPFPDSSTFKPLNPTSLALEISLPWHQSLTWPIYWENIAIANKINDQLRKRT